METGEVGYFWMRWRRYFGGSLEKKMEEWRRLENLVERKGRKEKGKRKRKWKREDILLEEKVKIMIVADSRDSVADAEIFRKNTGIVRKSSISERPAKILKNQEYYSKNHGEIHFKKFFIVLN